MAREAKADKSEKKSVSLPASMVAQIQAAADSTPGANFSSIIQVAVDRYLSGQPEETPDPLSPTIMVDLTRRLSGEIDANRMALKMGNQDQPLFLRELLRDVLGDESGIRDAIKSRPSPVDKYRPSESRNEGAG